MGAAAVSLWSWTSGPQPWSTWPEKKDIIKAKVWEELLRLLVDRRTSLQNAAWPPLCSPSSGLNIVHFLGSKKLCAFCHLYFTVTVFFPSVKHSHASWCINGIFEWSLWDFSGSATKVVYDSLSAYRKGMRVEWCATGLLSPIWGHLVTILDNL